MRFIKKGSKVECMVKRLRIFGLVITTQKQLDNAKLSIFVGDEDFRKLLKQSRDKRDRDREQIENIKEFMRL